MPTSKTVFNDAIKSYQSRNLTLSWQLNVALIRAAENFSPFPLFLLKSQRKKQTFIMYILL